MSAQTPIDRRQWDEAIRWLSGVDEDLRAVETLMSGFPPPFRSAAFRCQQAAEKMAKAVPIAFGAAAPKIHDIEELSWLVSDLDFEVGKSVQELAGLTAWYVAVRYPDVELDYAPSIQDVSSALTKLRDLRHRIDLLAPTA